jgi:tRNA dimethylallyltransferase
MSLIVCLMGPTASGKTQLAVDLVQRYPFEIISVDSAMVYKGMDIGTAKPDPDILRIAPHRLINICDPRDAYSAAQFRSDALREIEDIQSNHKIPLLVGGTMMYFRTLQKGIAAMPSANASLRAELLKDAQLIGWPKLHERLQEVDPDAARRIHPHDSQRIQRALEVFILTGKSLTAWQNDQVDEDCDRKIINITIAPDDRAVLHQRIATRFVQMLENGFVEEVKHLMHRGDLTLDLPSMRSVGYRQVWEYLEGKYSYAEMCEKGIIATRQLAKRQLTWLRSWPDHVMFNSEANDLLLQVANFLDATIF